MDGGRGCPSAARSKTSVEAARSAPCLFQAEADSLTHTRFLREGAPEGRVQVFHREARRRAVYRLRGGRMVALADAS